MSLHRLILSRVEKVLRRVYKRPERRPYVYFNFLNHLVPVSHKFGFDRGQPIGRYYIDAFLFKHSDDIQGRALEIQEPVYTKKFGGASVTRSDVLDIVDANPNATIIGNLETGESIPTDSFDCMIITHTYQYIFDLKAAILNSYNALKPGGVLLATVPGICKVSRDDMISRHTTSEDDNKLREYWRFTHDVVERLFEEIFQEENVTVSAYGSVLTASAFLYGFASGELGKKKMDHHDPDYPVLISVRARRPLDVIPEAA